MDGDCLGLEKYFGIGIFSVLSRGLGGLFIVVAYFEIIFVLRSFELSGVMIWFLLV